MQEADARDSMKEVFSNVGWLILFRTVSITSAVSLL